MADEHIAKILKMLEEGKITAAEAEGLLSTLHSAKSAPPPGGPSATPPPSSEQPPRDAKGATGAGTPPPADGETSRSFQFKWSRKSQFPLDLTGLGKQISDAVKSINPEKMVREATTSFAREGKRLRERMKTWNVWTDEDGPPENTLGQPTAVGEEDVSIDVAPDCAVHVENHYGNVTIAAGTGPATLHVDKEAWAATQAEADALLRELRVETTAFPGADAFTGGIPPVVDPAAPEAPQPAAARLEVRVVAREGWRDGLAHLRLTIPDGASVTVATGFGAATVENVGGRVEARTVSGEVSLQGLRGDARAESIAGDLRAADTAGSLGLTTRSGELHVRAARKGVVASAVSGSIDLADVEGGRVDARSASGDVTVRGAGVQAPLDLNVESVSGDVELTDAHGNVTIKTTSGDIVAARLEAVTLQAQSVSGDISARVSVAFSGTFTATTVSGDVSVRVPDGSNYRFALDTHTGALACETAAANTVHTDRMWAGTVGTGAGMLTVQTVSGDVHLADRGEA